MTGDERNFGMAKSLSEKETIPSPNRRYSIIYADPPWGYRNKGTRGAATRHYDTMTVEEIKSLPVLEIADENCVLFLWATFPMLGEALEVMEAWGFTYKTVGFTWVKENRRKGGLFWGLGNWTRSNAEICLLATRGAPKRVSGGVHSVILSPIEGHSRKPEGARERIVQLMGELPRIELFAREPHSGWDVWGDEVNALSLKEDTAE